MKSRIELCLKTAWLATAISLLLVRTSLCESSNTTCEAANGLMLTFMLILSFPLGAFFAISATLFLGTLSFEFPSDFVLWLMMAVGGFLQWFVVVPGLIANRELTILNLNQKDSRLETPGRKPAVATRPKRIKPVSAFDNRGRSPLERVITRVS